MATSATITSNVTSGGTITSTVTTGSTITGQVVVGGAGAAGATGPAGVGVPVGGTINQVLAKTSGADYATGWVDQSGGGGDTTYVNVKNFGATGDGATDDYAAIQAAATMAFTMLTASATLYFPAGQYNTSAALDFTSGGIGLTLRGDGRQASIIYKTGSGYYAVTWNGSGGPDGNPTSFGGIIDMTIEGAGTTGGLMQTNSANQMFFRGVAFNGSADLALDLNTMQDSYFLQCTWNTNSSATATVHMYASADGNSNMIWFSQCRWEDFTGAAVLIDSSFDTNIGFYFESCKIETGRVSSHLFIADTNTLELHISKLFVSMNGQNGGFTAPIYAIKSGAYQNASYRDVYVNDGIGGQKGAIDVDNSQYGIITLDNVFYNGEASVGTVNFDGFQGASFDLGAVGTDGSGPALAGDSSGFNTVVAPSKFLGKITADKGLSITANATLPSGMGLDAPFGTAALRFVNMNTSGSLQFVSVSGAINNYVGGNDVFDIASTFVQINKGYTLAIQGATSGSTTLMPSAVASGSLTLPAATDTLVGKATTDSFTNKNLTSGTNTFPTFNQNTTGSAATLTTARTINGVSFNGSANITVPSIVWTAVTGTTQAAAVNSGYITNNAGLVTVTLPSTAAVGSMIEICGQGAGGWLVAQAASVSIKFGSAVTTTGTGGSLASTTANDTLRLLCTTANTGWTVLSSVGNITVV